MSKQDIVLRTHTHELSDLRHLRKHVVVKNFSGARREGKETCNHRDRSCLPCSVMSEQCKYLVCVHGYAYVLYRLLPVLEPFIEVLNSKAFVLLVKLLQLL